MAPDYSTALAVGSSITLGITMVGFAIVFVFMLFFVGVMVYYFTGTKPGAHLLNGFMRVAARFYTQLWMLVAMLIGWVGMISLLRAILGSVFPDFVYGRSSSNLQVNDFQVGIILIMFSVIVFAVHWGIAYVIETKTERKGTLITKLFTGLGLVISGIFFFSSLLMLVLEVLAYVQQRSGATIASRPGQTLALLLATLPVWVYYILRTLEIVRNEAGAKK